VDGSRWFLQGREYHHSSASFAIRVTPPFVQLRQSEGGLNACSLFRSICSRRPAARVRERESRCRVDLKARWTYGERGGGGG